MKQKFRVILFFLFVTCSLSPASSAWSKVYIDITSPALKKLPVAISDLAGPSGREISDMIRDDLDFSGIFACLDRNAFLENPMQPFNKANWSVIGAEAVLKGVVRGERNLVVEVSFYDVTEGKEIFKKEYQADALLLRPVGHAIANDIYAGITGERGIFRTRIAYIVRQAGQDSLNIMDWDGKRTQNLGVTGSIILAPHWSPEGSKLVYASERYRQWGIYLLDFRKAAEKKAFSSKGINMAGDFFPGADEFAMSSSMDGAPNLYLYKMSEARLIRVSRSRDIEVSPTVSPDGRQIAFVSDRGGSPQIFIMTREGYDVRRITFSGSYNTSPSWSPRGDRIVFSGRQGGRIQIFTISPDGSDITQLTERGNNEDPCFSPDGRYIAFTSDRGGEKAVFIMRANGEAQKRVTPGGVWAFGPRWSPY